MPAETLVVIADAHLGEEAPVPLLDGLGVNLSATASMLVER